MRMEPGFWLRRWTRFPRFYESHNPSIMIRLKRVSDDYEGWDERDAYFIMETEREDIKHEQLLPKRELAELALGQEDYIHIRNLYCPQPGNVVLFLAFGVLGERDKFPMYSYRVEQESGPWLWGAWILSLVITALVTLGVGRAVGVL